MDEKEENGRLVLERKLGSIVPPKPLATEDMSQISGGESETNDAHDVPAPEKHHNILEMEVVKLEDGRYVKVPKDAIFNTEEEAKKCILQPPPPPFGRHPHRFHGIPINKHHEQEF